MNNKYTFEKMLRHVQKPGRYVGGERCAVWKDPEKVDVRFAFCFPDIYEVGMSHLGIKILADCINSHENMWCERAFAPWFDMHEQMLENGWKLTTLESKTPLCEYDIVGFTLQYEMSYPTLLSMLDLGGITLLSSERGEDEPLVVAGGPCSCNPEPLADFIDVFLLGEGEESIVELCEAVIEAKKLKLSKKETLLRISEIPGMYVPSLYEIRYNPDGTIADITSEANAPIPVSKRIIPDFDKVQYPSMFPLPTVEAIHDRANIEVLRGCIRGCRFCQAGFIYRPFRAKSVETLCSQAKTLCDNTGYDELSLVSLSTSDHPQIEELLDGLLSWTTERNIGLSLPSLRIDNFSDELIEKVSRVRKSGLTFAPEAGTQRLRDVINKNIDEEEIMKGCRTAFEGGYSAVKLYFIIGHPTETDEDVLGITQLAQRIVDLYYSLPNRPKGRSVSVTCSCACFVPKPSTPFEFVAQNTMAEFERKIRLLTESNHNRKIEIKWHDPSTSYVEAVLARGDRRIGKVILDVYRNGGVLESWDEGFSLERWQNALARCGLDGAFYANRERMLDEINAWEIVDYGIDKRFLIREYKKALEGVTTPKCSQKCSACGITRLYGRKCTFD